MKNCIIVSCVKTEQTVLMLMAFLLPFALSVWQLFDADYGRLLLSPFGFSDAYLYHYSAWYKSVFAVDSYVSEIIVFSPYERVLTETLRVFGGSTITPFFLNAVFTGLSGLIIVEITRRLFDMKSAWFALSIYTFTTPVLFFSGLTLKTGFVILLTSSAMLLAILFFKRPRVYLSIGFSLLIFIASIDRVHVLVAFVVFIIFLCWPSTNKQETMRYRLSALAVIFVALATMFISSNEYGSEPRYVSNVGLNIYLGHSKPDNYLLKVRGVRNHIIGHRVDSKRLAERDTKRSLTQAEVTQYWLSRTIRYIGDNPISYLQGQMQKLHHLFAARSNSFVGERAYLWHGERWPLKLTFIDFAAIFALFVVAAVALFRSRLIKREHVFLMVFCALYLLSIMATVVVERYRMVVLVCMIPMAAWGGLYLCQNIKNRWRMLVVAVSVFACSQLLAYTAPAAYHSKFDKDFSVEQAAVDGRIREFYAARSDVERLLNFKACTKFQRELMKHKFSFDVQRTRKICKSLKPRRR